MSESIRAVHLNKRFVDGSEPVRDVSLSVRTGRVHGLLGGPVSGKSTALGMLSTLIEPSSGFAEVEGLDVARYPDLVRDRVGIAFDRSSADPSRSGRQNLEEAARAAGRAGPTATTRISDLLERLGLTTLADRRAGNYPFGASRRLEVAQASVATPAVLFADEPTFGLSSAERALVWEFLRGIAREEGTTVFVATRSFSEARSLCDRYSVMEGGRLPTASPRSGAPAAERRSSRVVLGEGMPGELDAGASPEPIPAVAA
jgi:ABC-2 type transport system ATP-binding protein